MRKRIGIIITILLLVVTFVPTSLFVLAASDTRLITDERIPADCCSTEAVCSIGAGDESIGIGAGEDEVNAGCFGSCGGFFDILFNCRCSGAKNKCGARSCRHN